MEDKIVLTTLPTPTEAEIEEAEVFRQEMQQAFYRGGTDGRWFVRHLVDVATIKKIVPFLLHEVTGSQEVFDGVHSAVFRDNPWGGLLRDLVADDGLGGQYIVAFLSEVRSGLSEVVEAMGLELPPLPDPTAS